MSSFWEILVPLFPVFFKLGTVVFKNFSKIWHWFWCYFWSVIFQHLLWIKWKFVGKFARTKKRAKTIFLYLWFFQRNLVTCPVLSLFWLSKTFFFPKGFEKKKKLGGGLEPQDRTRTHRTYKHSYSILCHTGLGVPKTISPVVKTLTKVSVSSPPTKVVPIGTCVTIISVAVKSCNRRVGNPQNPVL